MNIYNFRRKASLRFYFIIFLSTLVLQVCAQDGQVDSLKFKHQVDIKDILQNLKKKDKAVKKKEDKKFQFALLPGIGYTSNTGFAVTGGANVAFTNTGSERESSALTSFTYTQFNQAILPFHTSIWTKKDRFNFDIDYRYINYPSAAYGLRGKSKLDSGYTVNFSWIKLHQSILTKITKDFYGGVGLFYDRFWNIKEEGVADVVPSVHNPKGLGSAFEYYTDEKTPSKNETAFGPAFRLLYDSRDNPFNASKGLYVATIFHPSFQKWGSDTSSGTFEIDARKYFSLSQKKYSVIAFWAYYWTTYGKSPFLLLPSTGWDELWNTGRGLSQGRYRGPEMRYLESEYRFQISNNGLLGGVLFTNIENFPNELYTSYSEYRGHRSADVTTLGYGMGLRLKLNKYTKTNLALDAGFGQAFPKPWITVNLGEVF